MITSKMSESKISSMWIEILTLSFIFLAATQNHLKADAFPATTTFVKGFRACDSSNFISNQIGGSQPISAKYFRPTFVQTNKRKTWEKSFVISASTNNEDTGVGNSRDDFWKEQQDLASSLKAQALEKEMTTRRENLEKYRNRSLALISETVYFSTLFFSLLWLVASSPSTPISYAIGAAFGTAYSYGLAKYVETLGGSVDDSSEVQGAGVGQARFAFLILLFIFVGKFRSQGLQEIPSIVGFFTYQLATLSQGLKEIED